MAVEAWFPKTSAHAQQIIDVARAVDAELPDGLEDGDASGVVAISVQSARALRKALRG